jgi:hypothetical protein
MSRKFTDHARNVKVVFCVPDLVQNVLSMMPARDQLGAGAALRSVYFDKFKRNQVIWRRKAESAYHTVVLSVANRADGTFQLLYNDVEYNPAEFAARHAAHVAKAAQEAPDVQLMCKEVRLVSGAERWVDHIINNPGDTFIRGLMSDATDLTLYIDNLEAWYDYDGPLHLGDKTFPPINAAFPNVTRITFADVGQNRHRKAVAWGPTGEPQHDRIFMLMHEHGEEPTNARPTFPLATFLTFESLNAVQSLLWSDMGPVAVPTPRFPNVMAIAIYGIYVNDVGESGYDWLLFYLGNNFHVPALKTIYVPGWQYKAMLVGPTTIVIDNILFDIDLFGTEQREIDVEGGGIRVTKRFEGEGAPYTCSWIVRSLEHLDL